MIKFYFLHPKMTEARLGLLPFFFSESDPRPAAEQLNSNYAHGGGFSPISGWKRIDPEGFAIKYPGDPILKPLAIAQLRTEVLVFYPYEWLGIFQSNGSFEVTRVD